MNRKLTKISLIVMILLLCPLFFSKTENSTLAMNQEDFKHSLNADPAIVIDEDSDFSIFPGYGNETHPYVIEGYDISQPDFVNPGISVTGTTMHFIIQNNIFENGLYGIYIEDIAPETATIYNNTLSHTYTGIYLKEANGTVVDDNIIDRIYPYNGIELFQSHHCNITNNYLGQVSGVMYYAGWTFKPITITSCTGVNIIGNEINQCIRSGIIIMSSSEILVQDNYIHDLVTSYMTSYAGIDLNYVDDSEFYNNTVDWLQTNLIRVVSCNRNSFKNNTLTGSLDYGMNIQKSSYNNITWNLFLDLPNFAILFWDTSHDNIIHHNNFTDNRDAGSQAKDYGSNNVWYDVTTNEGNWWSNWYCDTTYYSIAGTAGSVDPYPLGDCLPPIFPEFSFGISLLIVSVPIVCAIVIFLKKRK